MSSSLTRFRIIAIQAILVVTNILGNLSFGQDVQAWLDGFIVKPIGNSIENELNLGVNKLVQNNGWGEVYAANTLSWIVTGWYTAEAALELHYTNDPQAFDIREARVFLGQKFTFTRFIEKIHLEQPYFYARLEQRFLEYPDQDTTEQKSRIRLRLGGRFLLNNTTMSAGTYYFPFYFEQFYNFNGEALERFASRKRWVVGFGYNWNYRWRTELFYYAQRSRNSIEDSYVKTDMMFQLKIYCYLQ
jgi:hypothetical protein